MAYGGYSEKGLVLCVQTTELTLLDECISGRLHYRACSFAKLEQELVEIELTQEDDALEAVQVPEPRHVKYATVMAKNLRRSSHR